jgi:hypothetical protein
MGCELWISPNTGISRKGTTFKELQSIFVDKITTDFIYEPLYSCKHSEDARDIKELLFEKEFDIIGVTNESRVLSIANKPFRL